MTKRKPSTISMALLRLFQYGSGFLRAKKEEGRRKKEEGRGVKSEGRRKKEYERVWESGTK